MGSKVNQDIDDLQASVTDDASFVGNSVESLGESVEGTIARDVINSQLLTTAQGGASAAGFQTTAITNTTTNQAISDNEREIFSGLINFNEAAFKTTNENFSQSFDALTKSAELSGKRARQTTLDSLNLVEEVSQDALSKVGDLTRKVSDNFSDTISNITEFVGDLVNVTLTKSKPTIVGPSGDVVSSPSESLDTKQIIGKIGQPLAVALAVALLVPILIKKG